MSTILDALKKVERDRQPARGPLLEVPPPDAKRRRRRVSLGMIVACATLGFAAGVGIALWRNTAPVEIAAIAPAAVAPPAVDAPAQPDVAARPAAPAVASRPAIAPAPAQPATQPAAGAATTDAANDNAPTAPDDAQPQQLASAHRPSAPNANPNAPAVVPNAPGATDNAAAAAPNAPITNPKVDGRQGADEGSALEPSPFGRGRAGAADTATAPQALAPPAVAARKNDEVAAIAPPAPDDTTEPEEPAAPPAPEEKVIDTGRSPSGQPKVALSFLQWSADPERRFAFISIEGAPSQRVREGDTAGGLTVAAITPNGVRLKHDTTVFTITPRH